MRAMLGEVRTKASAMLKEHKKQGSLFTIAPAGAPRTALASRAIPGSAASADVRLFFCSEGVSGQSAVCSFLFDAARF